jgi:hypothetical protein
VEQQPEVQRAVDELPKPRNGYMKYGWSRPPSTRLIGPGWGAPWRHAVAGLSLARSGNFTRLTPRAMLHA